MCQGAPPFFANAITKFGLTPKEAAMLDSQCRAQWANISQTIPCLDGLPSGEREQFDRSTRSYFTEPTMRFWFNHSNATLSPESVRYIEDLINQPSTAS